VGETIQEIPTSGDDTVDRIAEQLEEITDDDQLSILLVDEVKEGVEQRFAVTPA
jgi:hypothetical protein